MQPRWNYARPRHDPTPRLTHRGWKARKYLLLPVEGEKLSLTSPLIDQAIALKIPRSGYFECNEDFVTVENPMEQAL
jgi:hypothetical protein